MQYLPCHVIQRIWNLRRLKLMASHDVASAIWQAILGGDTREAARPRVRGGVATALDAAAPGRACRTLLATS
jgi:hypothetical protein